VHLFRCLGSDHTATLIVQTFAGISLRASWGNISDFHEPPSYPVTLPNSSPGTASANLLCLFPWLASYSFSVAQYIFSVPTVDTVLPSPDVRSHHIPRRRAMAPKIYALVATVGLLAHVVGGPTGADSWLTTPVTPFGTLVRCI
jgi:hypothetical protein